MRPPCRSRAFCATEEPVSRLCSTRLRSSTEKPHPLEKTTSEDDRKIFCLHFKEGVSVTDLSVRFRVNRRTIRRIIAEVAKERLSHD